MAAPVATLSTRGFITAPAEKLDFLLSYFFETDGKQSYLYPDNILSIQSLVANYPNDMTGLCAAMRQKLSDFLSPYFDSTDVDISDSTASDPSNKVTIYISGQVTQDGKTYGLNTVAQQVNSQFQRVLDYNNTGVMPTSS